MRHQGGPFVETYRNSLLAFVSSPKDIEGMTGEFNKPAKGFSHVEVLRRATAQGGELLGLFGVLNPYAGHSVRSRKGSTRISARSTATRWTTKAASFRLRRAWTWS